MLKSTIPASKGILFETALEPATATIERLRMEKGFGEGEIKGFHGGINKVAVGYPYSEDLMIKIQNEKEEIPYQIKSMMYNYDFHFVTLYCSFLPDSRNKFSWARFGVDLYAEPKSNASLEKKERPPIAHDMFPNEVLIERKCKKEISFSPELKLKLLDIVEAGITYEVRKSSEFVVYEPQIIGYGIRTPSVAWDFKSTEQKGIWGNKELLLVIMTPKNSKIKGKFFIGAEIESDTARRFPIPLATKRDDKIISIGYDLSE